MSKEFDDFMNNVAKLGNEDVSKLGYDVKKLAEQSWEGCDGCDENDKNFFINGFRTGYYRATPDEISDEEIEIAAANLANPNADKTDNWIEGSKWYREQLKNGKAE
jgi:hypothetical protein